jgi:cytochrome c-type biogenesis protein CcmH/NrfG
MRGRAARRRSAGDEAVRAFQEAVMLAGQVPNVMLNRLQGELSSMTS